MRRPLLVAAALLCGVTLHSQTPDSELLRQADFSGKRITEHAPEGANCTERALYTVRKQLTGRDFYEPANYMFVRPAVREIGFIPAFFATSDRILRDTRIGTASLKLDPSDPFVHEGPGAYAPWKKTVKAVPVRTPFTGAVAAPGSSRWVSEDYEFAGYLIDNELKQDARKLLTDTGYHASDTLSYLRGWAHYQLKELEPAVAWLRSVPSSSAFYDRSFFYANALDAHLGDYSGQVAGLEAYSGPYAELKGLQLAGLALLRDDPAAFRSAAQSFSHSDFTLAEAEEVLDGIYDTRYCKPQKSPWLAAAASAVIPGLGKVYAGNIGEGVSSFLITGAMGAITAEHWVKDGPKNWKTIVPAVLTAVLYIGNIYGSYVSVSIYNNQLKDAQETAILYNIHIPLRAVFK